jgi:NADH:ubiquinone oxidoreductase subunit 5 (subunit L)/multisubunit Na+/H+ antiporter MnhA subunit
MVWTLALLPALTGAALVAAAPRSRGVLALTAGVALAMTLALALMGAVAGWVGAHAWGGPLVLTAALPVAAGVVAVLVPAIALPVTVYAAAHEQGPGLARLIGLLLVFVGGMELLVIASDLLTLLIGWEIVGACSWALIGHRWRDARTSASGRYAFVMTRFGDLGLFLAAMAAYAGTGAFAYADLAGLEGVPLVLVAFGILVSAAAKAGQVPFSPWLFRAMDGPTSVSALLHAATMVAAGSYVLIRLEPVLGGAPGFHAAAIAVGLTTALAGGVVAVVQDHAKKLLAASTSAHYGLMIVAVGAGYPDVALVHLVVHAGFKALLFLVAGSAGERAGTYALHAQGLGRELPGFAAFSAVAALSLAGVPPMGGGLSKEAITTAAGHVTPWLAGGVILAGALSAAYAARFHVLAYRGMSDPPGDGPRPGRLEQGAAGALAVLTLATAMLWLPAVKDWLDTALGIALPKAGLVELVLSLILIGVGLLAGAFLARRLPTLGTAATPAAVGDWLGLPGLVEAAAVRPFARLAAGAAWLDDSVLDALPRGVARGARGLRRGLARADGRAVDGGVRATAAFGLWLAAVGNRIGEAIADGLPEGTGRLILLSGGDLRRLQTGLSHHYYALLAGGALVLILTLVVLS